MEGPIRNLHTLTRLVVCQYTGQEKKEGRRGEARKQLEEEKEEEEEDRNRSRTMYMYIGRAMDVAFFRARCGG